MPSCLGDRLARDDVVAGHHPHADVGVLGVADRVLGLGSGRIDHSDHRRHLQVRDEREEVAVGVEVRGVDVPGGRDHDAQPLAAEALHLLGGSGVLLVAPGNGLAVGQGGRSAPDHCRSGSLDERPDDGLPGRVLGIGEDGHELVRGIERQGREPGVGSLRAFDVELRLVPEDEQRTLGGIADDLAVDELGVVGDQEGQDRLLDRVGVAGGVLDVAVEAVAHPGDRVAVRGVDHLDDRDLVQRERARLVRVDRRGRAQGLDGGEALHDGALRRERRRPVREDDLQDGGHGHRHGGQGQRDGRREDDLGRVATRDPEGEHDRDRQARGARDPQRQRVQLRGQRSLQRGRRLQHPGDVPHLGVGTRPGDDHHAASVRDGGVHERHVRLVADARLRVAGDDLGALRRGNALTGQPGLVDLQGRGLDDPPVGAHVVTRGEQDDVTDDHLVGVDLDLRSRHDGPGRTP